MKYCCDQARDELLLMMGGGAATGVAGSIPIIGAGVFNASLTVVQAAVVTRIAQVYNVDIIARCTSCSKLSILVDPSSYDSS